MKKIKLILMVLIVMADNKKYYYIKLKDNYFDQDNIKILESFPNGHVYSLIIVKLYLKATKYGGQLRMTESIPYDPSKINILASVLNHDIDHVKKSIELGSELGIISIIDGGEMWMSEIQNFIGQSSTEADRKREYRKQIESKERQMSGHNEDKTTPEKEKELEKEKEKELKEHTEHFFQETWKMYPSKKGKGKVSITTKKQIYKLGDEFKRCITRYIAYVEHRRKTDFPELKYQNGLTFYNKGYVDYLDENYQEETEDKKSNDGEWGGWKTDQ